MIQSGHKMSDRNSLSFSSLLSSSYRENSSRTSDLFPRMIESQRQVRASEAWSAGDKWRHISTMTSFDTSSQVALPSSSGRKGRALDRRKRFLIRPRIVIFQICNTSLRGTSGDEGLQLIDGSERLQGLQERLKGIGQYAALCMMHHGPWLASGFEIVSLVRPRFPILS